MAGGRAGIIFFLPLVWLVVEDFFYPPLFFRCLYPPYFFTIFNRVVPPIAERQRNKIITLIASSLINHTILAINMALQKYIFTLAKLSICPFWFGTGR